MLFKTNEQCDEQLAFDLAENSQFFDDKNSAEMGFEFADQCTSKGGQASGELKCCGDFPTRFPYHSRNGSRDCCGSRVFNTESHKCCADNRLTKTNYSC